MNSTINVGVIGCGYWGPNLVRNLRAARNGTVLTVCDQSADRLRHIKSLYPDVTTETDFRRLIDDPRLDAIAIATPVRFHYAMAKPALEAGKHVFVEKPMAATAKECEELIEIARRRGLTLMVGHTFLYSPAIRKVKEIVDSGQLGEIRYISARRLNLGLFQTDINVAWDLAPHDLSIILYIMNELPRSVNCRGSAHITPGIEDVASISLQFSEKRNALIHCSWLDPRKVREMTIVGSKAMIVYDDLEPQEKVKIFDMRVDAPPHYDSFAEFQFAYHYGDKFIPYIKQEEPLRNETQHFLDCIASGESPITGGDNGLAIVRILEAASESARNSGAPVELNPFPLPAVT